MANPQPNSCPFLWYYHTALLSPYIKFIVNMLLEWYKWVIVSSCIWIWFVLFLNVICLVEWIIHRASVNCIITWTCNISKVILLSSRSSNCSIWIIKIVQNFHHGLNGSSLLIFVPWTLSICCCWRNKLGLSQWGCCICELPYRCIFCPT
jgi:hypothetical protein